MIYLVTSVGGMCMATLLYRSRLIPRPITILGVIGYPALLVGCILDMFNLADVTQGLGRLIHKSNLMTVTTPSPSDVSVIL